MFKFNRFTKAALILVLISVVFVVGCGEMGGASSCGGTSAQGWSGFTPYKNVICFGSMEGKIIALSTSARSENKTFPAEGEWAYIMKTSAPGAACGAMCSPSSSAASAGVYSTPTSAGELMYCGTYTGKIYALNANRGVVRWVYPREWYENVG